MVEAYFTAMAAEYFIGIAITIGVIIIAILIKAYIWMCDRRKKRLERMMDKYFEGEEPRDGDKHDGS